jgi:short-subunit dehydrogenase
MKPLSGKTALITGAAGGLGSALAALLASKGCHLALVDINGDTLKQLADSLEGQGVTISCHTADLCDRHQLMDLVDALKEQYTSIDILINNAGITLQKSAENHRQADWDKVFQLNFLSAVFLSRELLPLLRNRGQGHIVNLSSMAAFFGLPSQCSYSSSKAALQKFSDSLRAELSGEGIGVSCIHPGAIKTNMILATLKESDDVQQAEKNMLLAQRFGVSANYAAQRIVRAIEHNKRSICIGVDARIFKIVSGAFPGLLSQLLAKTFARLS